MSDMQYWTSKDIMEMTYLNYTLILIAVIYQELGILSKLKIHDNTFIFTHFRRKKVNTVDELNQIENSPLRSS